MKLAVSAASEVVVVMGVIITVIAVVQGLLAPRGTAATLGAGLSLTLEFFLAAGLLRLATHPNLRGLGLAAFIIVLRRMISAGLRFGRAAAG